MISCYTSNRSELKIAQIEANDQIKVWLIKIGGLGYFGAFGVIWGQNDIIFKHSQMIYQIEAQAPLVTIKKFSRSFDPKLGEIKGHMGSKFKDFQTWANYRPKWSSCSRVYFKVVFKVNRGHNTPSWGQFLIKKYLFSHNKRFKLPAKNLITILVNWEHLFGLKLKYAHSFFGFSGFRSIILHQ